MTRENRHTKAARLVTQGRVVIDHVADDQVTATVRGDDGTYYRVTHRGVLWRCTCANRGDRCSHITACRLVCAPTRADNGPTPLGGRVTGANATPSAHSTRSGDASPRWAESHTGGAA